VGTLLQVFPEMRNTGELLDVTELIVSVAVPELVHVTVCGELLVPVVTLPNGRVRGVQLIDGAGEGSKVKERIMESGPVDVSSGTVSVADCVPMAVGVKIAVNVQDAPGPILELFEQVSDESVNLVLLEVIFPLIAMTEQPVL